MNTKTRTCKGCNGPLCPTCGGCIQEGECSCYSETWESPIDGFGEEEREMREGRLYREVETQRDQLLAACETIHEWLGTDDAAQALPFEPPWYQQLRAAIAKAKEQANQ